MWLWLLVLFCCLARACSLGAGELFHLAWTSDAASFAPWRTAGLRSIERHYAGQPLLLRLYTNSLSAADLGPFASLHVHITPIDDALFAGTPLVEWWAQAAAAIARRGLNLSDTKDYLYSHLTDAIRYAALWKHGGVYADFDVILLRPLTVFTNSLGAEGSRNRTRLNFAVARFEAAHPFLLDVMTLFARRYHPACWPCVGPALVSELVQAYDAKGRVRWHDELPLVAQSSSDRGHALVHVFGHRVFYPIGWHVSFVRHRGSAAAQLATARQHSATLHVWSSAAANRLAPGARGPPVERGSLLDLILEDLGMVGPFWRGRL